MVNSKNKTNNTSNNVAKNLDIETRQQIGLAACSQKDSISELSRQYQTSRKFIYEQQKKVENAVQEVFSKKTQNTEVLYIVLSI